MSKPGLFLWKKAFKYSKEYSVSGCLKQDKVPGNGEFLYRRFRNMYVKSIVFGYRLLSKPGLFLWKKAFQHSKEYFVSGFLKQDKVPGNEGFHTLD